MLDRQTIHMSCYVLLFPEKYKNEIKLSAVAVVIKIKGLQYCRLNHNMIYDIAGSFIFLLLQIVRFAIRGGSSECS